MEKNLCQERLFKIGEEMTSQWQAYQLALAGVDPDDVQPRQIAFEDMLEDLVNHG